MYKYFSLLFLILTLTGCQKVNLSFSEKQSETEPEVTNAKVSLSDVLSSENVIIVEKEGRLLAADPQYPAPVEIYTFEAQELPLAPNLKTFLLSPDRSHIVWYSQNKGVLSLDLTTLSTQVIYEPTGWFIINPHLEMHPLENMVYLIDEKGSQLVSIVLGKNEVLKSDIPFPFGNIFKIAPDGEKVIYVAGFGQSKGNPQFLFSNLKGDISRNFITTTEISERDIITWLPDSSGVLMIDNSNTVMLYPFDDPSKATEFYTFSDDTRIQQLIVLNNTLFVFTNQGSWHGIDIETRNEIMRTPMEIAQELNSPQFIPWEERMFLIEDTITSADERYKKLWLSNYKGVKKLIIDKYHHESIDIADQVLE